VFSFPERSVALSLIPPSPVTNQISLEIRGAVWNQGEKGARFDLRFYLDREEDETLIHSESAEVSPGACESVAFRWPTAGHTGEREIILVASSGERRFRIERPIEILESEHRSTETIGGAWVEFYHWSEDEGRPWNEEVLKMTDDQWRESIRAMHEIRMDVAVLEEVFRNQMYYGEHRIEEEGYQGKAYYPSQLYPGRMPIAATDPIEAALDEADKHDMAAFLGVGLYAWFDFTPGSLEWHKKVADELFVRYGHHPSFYGWYISEEIHGNLGGNPKRHREIADFFREFAAHVHRYAPEKPIALAPNCFEVPSAESAWREVLENCDIICPFGFHRMPENDLMGTEVAELFQRLCDETGAHLWMDMEAFTFGPDNQLFPRATGEVVGDLRQYTDFEKILCYGFTGLMNPPWATRKPGGEATVQAYEGYRKYVEGRFAERRDFKD
jgi:hypothetical protein